MAKASLNPNAGNNKPIAEVVAPSSASAFAGMQIAKPATDAGFQSNDYGSYIVFTHNMSPKYKDIIRAHPNVREGDPVLIQADKTPIILDPFRCFLVPNYFEYAVKYDGTGQVIEVSEDLALVASGDKKDKDRWKASAETILIVCTPEGLKSCRCTFKEVKLNAFLAGKQGILDAATADDWATRSAAHTASIGVPFTWMRTVLTVTMKNGKSSNGFSYAAANGNSVVISDANDYKIIADWMANTLEQSEGRTTIKAHEDRIKQLKGLIK